MLYFLFLLMFIPLFARVVDRVPLPAHNSDYIGPANYMTVVLGRNYVKKDLYEALISAVASFGDKHPEAKIVYLDAGFALSSWIPMWPHKSHNSGKSLDLAFIYNDTKGDIQRGTPTWTGYGEYVTDKPNKALRKCLDENSSYDFSKLFGLSVGKNKYVINKRLTQDLIQNIHKESKIKTIFLEPYLKKDLGLSRFKKIKFQGCNSVRHDDHMHIEIE